MHHLEQILASLVGSVPALIYAILLLIIAVIVAAIAKAIVVNICRRLNLGEKLSKHGAESENGANELVELLGKIVFVFVFVLFLPGILDHLNLRGVSQPITNMMNSLVGYLPNIIGALAILIIGNLIAKTVKQIVVSILSRVKVDKLQEKIGIQTDETTIGFSSLIGNIVYALILIVAAISSLHVLNIQAISGPAVSMLNSIFAMIPNVFIALLLIFVGVMIGRLAGSLLSALLSGIGVNNLMKDVLKAKEGSKSIVLSNLIGDFVKYIIVVLFVVQSFSVLHLDVLNNLGVMIISYLPNFVGAVIILGFGLFLSSLMERTLKNHASISPLFAKLIKCVIMAMTVFMTLNQLNIAAFIVNAAFVIILCAIAIAFAIAFGLGGRDFAAKTLECAKTSFAKKNDEDNA